MPDIRSVVLVHGGSVFVSRPDRVAELIGQAARSALVETPEMVS
jgi:hypothetical protein